MWIKALEGQIVNLEHLLTIGINTRVAQGKFTVVGVFPHHADGNWVPLKEFGLRESAEAYVGELFAALPQLSQKVITYPQG